MISAVVLTKNEEKNVKEFLKRLKWCGEIIVVDDYSEDKTVELAKKHGARVYKSRLNDSFAQQRNFGLEKARGEWVLFIDADERVSEELAAEIKQKTGDRRQKAKGFYVKRRDIMWGRQLKHGETGNTELLRLARKGAGKWRRRVHEVWEVSGPVETLKNPLYHYPHQTLREFIADVDWMSTLHARALKEEGKTSNVFKILFYPPAKFFHGFFLKIGFMDGTAGFVSTAVMSFHSFLGWAKLWKL